MHFLLLLLYLCIKGVLRLLYTFSKWHWISYMSVWPSSYRCKNIKSNKCLSSILELGCDISFPHLCLLHSIESKIYIYIEQLFAKPNLTWKRKYCSRITIAKWWMYTMAHNGNIANSRICKSNSQVTWFLNGFLYREKNNNKKIQSSYIKKNNILSKMFPDKNS